MKRTAASRWIVWLLCVCSITAGRSDILVGRAPTFSYSYSPRPALGLDTNASNVAVSYVHESPTNQNCSYIVPASTATPASGTVSYVFRPDSGFVIQNLVLIQRAGIFTSGGIVGEYSTDGGTVFRVFFTTPTFQGTTFTLTRQVRLHYLNATNLIVRYTITRTGSSRSVQLFRDCDDVPAMFSATGTIVSEAEAKITRGISLVNQGATWKYLDNGSDQGTAWRQPAFNDSAWASGAAEFGYGDGDEVTVNSFGPSSSSKYITTYFRSKFVATNTSSFRRVTVGLLRDDGAVVYLNGTEVFRSNLPAGTITYTTLGSSAVDNLNESAFFETTVNPTNIITGTNTLAVEIHQQRVDSSDISFDLDLRGELDFARPVLELSRVGGCVRLSWDAPGFIVESAPDVTGPWEPLIGNPASPYSVCGNLDQRSFFRLKLQP